jgi:hypothetical protein
MHFSLVPALLVAAALGAAAPEDRPLSPYEGWGNLTPETQIDQLVFARLKQLGIEPARLSSDEVFVRRVYLDTIGTLPTPAEVRQFLQDRSPDKRRTLIDRLLQRDEFADYWGMKWSDLLRVKAEFPINLWPNAAQAYHRWIRTAVKENVPCDRFVRDLLTASGSNFRDPQANFYRALQSREPEAIAQAVALAFLGERAERWPKERLAGMAVFFSCIRYKETGEWKEEIVAFDPERAAALASSGALAKAVFPDGTPARLTPERDPREVFADWLVSPKNPYFARSMANRAWYWLAGRGIVHEPDDLRPDNPPSNAELLAYLERELVASRFDLKHVFRLILNSKTYQFSSVPRSKHPQAEANFASYPLRRLEAEVLIDALNQVTGTTERYSSMIPEPFTFVPAGERSIALPDGSIGSPFLELFGRPPRDTGLESERNNRPTAAQRLHLLNSSHIQRKIEQSPKLQALLQSSKRPREVVVGLYLLTLSRYPTDEELKIAAAHGRDAKGASREAAVDLAWALLNSDEFLYRH